MKRIFLILLLIVGASYMANAQDLSLWSKDTLEMVNTAGHTATLSAAEKKLVQLINLARLDGNAFMKRIAMPYI